MEKYIIRIVLGMGALVFAMSANANEFINEGTDAFTFKLHEMSKPKKESQFQAQQGADYVTPTQLVPLADWPSLVDDLNLEGMELAIERQIKRYKQKSLSGTIKLGNNVYSQKQALKSLEKFFEYVQDYKLCAIKKDKGTCQDRFERSIRAKFNMYAPKLAPGDPRYGEDKQTLFTAYYTPLIKGKEVRDSNFKYGIYNKPTSKNLAQSSRREIDFQDALIGKGHTVTFSDDLFELYLLHVQGGGHVIEEGKNGQQNSYYISYDGTNSQKFTFISKYMVSKGYIPDLSIQAQRDFLDNNPQKHEEIYSTCPSYVFFKKTSFPPLGNDGVSLTDNRSIATDTAYYRFKGMIAFVSARKPMPLSKNKEERAKDSQSVEYEDFSRFFLDQDTGGAIDGKARVDMYFGEGDYAAHVAYNTVQRGDLYFLMLK